MLSKLSPRKLFCGAQAVGDTLHTAKGELGCMSKIKNVERSKNGSKGVWGRGCSILRGGLLEAISFVDAWTCWPIWLLRATVS
jgi:hypothetical protein